MVVDVQQQQQQQQQQHTTPPATHIDTLFAAVVVAFPVVLKYASGFNKIADSAQVLLPADAQQQQQLQQQRHQHVAACLCCCCYVTMLISPAA